MIWTNNIYWLLTTNVEFLFVSYKCQIIRKFHFYFINTISQNIFNKPKVLQCCFNKRRLFCPFFLSYLESVHFMYKNQYVCVIQNSQKEKKESDGRGVGFWVLAYLWEHAPTWPGVVTDRSIFSTTLIYRCLGFRGTDFTFGSQRK